MNIQETTNALALAQAFDNRTVGEGNVRAWHAVLADEDAADVMEAIRQHYGAHTTWVMPAHIRSLTSQMREERAKAARQWAPGQFGVPVAEALPVIERGQRLTRDDISPEVLEMLSRLRASLPDTGRDALHPRRVAWEREQRAFQRAEQAEPNPHYRPAPKLVVDPDPAKVDRAARIADCRTNGPHDDGLHIEECPDRSDVTVLTCRGCKKVITEEGYHAGTGLVSCTVSL